jgi:hypothetical protein
MKKISPLLAGIVLIVNVSFAGTPPAAVQKAFEKMFPNALKVSWSKETAKEWEAEFTFEGSSISANFAEDGTWLETEKEIKPANLPKAVSDAIKTKFPGWTISEADKTETSKQGIIYEVELRKGTVKKSVAFKDDGTPASG